MFDDFSQNPTSGQSRKRFRNSMAAAVVIYGSSGAAIVGATAGVKHVVEEDLTQVEFAPPPEPEPPPPEPEPPPEVAKPQPSRPKMKRAAIKPPDEIPLEKPKESDAPLAAAGESGPVDGFLTGVEGGTGTKAPPPPPPPPPPKAGPLVPPREAGNNPRPEYPKAATRKGVEGTVVVSFDVLENGRVANPQIVSGPKELHECVLKAALTWRYKPAMRDGKPVRSRTTKRVTFRLEDG